MKMYTIVRESVNAPAGHVYMTGGFTLVDVEDGAPVFVPNASLFKDDAQVFTDGREATSRAEAANKASASYRPWIVKPLDDA